MNLNGFEYEITHTCVAYFPDQNWPGHKTAKFRSLSLEPGDVITVRCSLAYRWNGYKFATLPGSKTP